MESYLPNIKQLYNVKKIAGVKEIDALEEGELGIFPDNAQESVSVSSYNNLPKKFRLISRINGNLMFGIETIEKSKMRNQSYLKSQDQKVNIWETTLTNCNCMKTVVLNINIDEDSLWRRDGATWTHRDFVVEVQPHELSCLCDLDKDNKVRENNLFTEIVYKNVNAKQSPFYEAAVKVDLTNVESYATVTARDNDNANPDKGHITVVESVSRMEQYDGEDYVPIGDQDGTLTDVSSYNEFSEGINTNEDGNDDGPMLKLVIKGKVQESGDYNILDTQFNTLPGVSLHPVIDVNDGTPVEFKEKQELRFSVGKGYNLRAEEFDNMNNYTSLNHYPQLSDGLPNPKLKYQFENGKSYDVVTFDFLSPNTVTNDGREKLLGMTLGSETLGDQLNEIFVP